MKKVLALSALGGLLTSSLYSFDYSVSGSAENFTKWGFNNQSFVPAEHKAPTDSFASLVAKLDLNADLGAGFKFGLGGAIGGLVLDSTKNNINSWGSQVAMSYFGNSYDKGRVQNAMIHNAFLEYSNDIVYLKAGRYEAGKVGEWFSGYNQGVEGYVKAGPVKIWGFLSNRRGFAYGQWFYDFYRVHGTYDGYIDGNGKKVGGEATRNTYAVGLDFSASGLTASLFSYYTPGTYTAPGVSLTFDSNPAKQIEGFKSFSKIRFLAPIADTRMIGGQSGREWGYVNKDSYILNIEQKFEIDAFFLGGGYYRNFGNANELIGRWGNPVSLDMWTANAYDIGYSLSDMAGKNAATGYGFVGANYGSFDWKLQYRGTKSPRSDEQSVALFINYQLREDIAVGGKVEWLADTTKAGYSPLYGWGGSKLTKNQTDDRSHAFFYIRHTF